MIVLKRVYEPASPKDGVRILVERLWPRGVKKSSLHLEQWQKKSLRAKHFGSGSIMILRDGKSSSDDTFGSSMKTKRSGGRFWRNLVKEE